MRENTRTKPRMETQTTIPILDRLIASAQKWAALNERTPGALASIVVNHGSFFDRVVSGKASTTTATLEKFARFFADAGNWRDGTVPEDVRLFVHMVGVTPEPVGETTGNINNLSGGISHAGTGTN